MHSDFIFLNYVHIPSSLGSNQNVRSVKIYYNFNMYYLHQHITVLRVHAVLKQDHSSIAWTPMSSTTWFIYFLGGRMWICCLTVLTIHFIYIKFIVLSYLCHPCWRIKGLRIFLWECCYTSSTVTYQNHIQECSLGNRVQHLYDWKGSNAHN